MQTHVQKYYDQGIYTFTFEGITADTNDKGKVVKKSHGFPNWKQIDRGNFMNYTFNHHRALAVLTGKISNITGIDFDIKEEYEKDFWKLYKTDFWETYEDEYLEIYIDIYEKEEIETEFLLNYIFNPIIKKFDMYCMGIVLAEVVLLKYEISDYNVLHKFEKLIQSILFNQFDDVNDIITEINKLNSLLI